MKTAFVTQVLCFIEEKYWNRPHCQI